MLARRRVAGARPRCCGCVACVFASADALQEVGLGWVRLANTLTDEEHIVEADTVVTALGGRAEHALEGALVTRGLEVPVVGDALAPRTIHDAILTATRAARRL